MLLLARAKGSFLQMSFTNGPTYYPTSNFHRRPILPQRANDNEIDFFVVEGTKSCDEDLLFLFYCSSRDLDNC